VTFPIVTDPNTKFVAWTTTPWTLPSNLALAVNPNFVYLKIKDIKKNEIYIIAECRIK
jgi:isoleucyl-tRNA synthetase